MDYQEKAARVHGIAPIKGPKNGMIFVTPITTLIKSDDSNPIKVVPAKADHTDNRRVNDLSNKETIEHLICITKFFLNDSRPLIWKNTIQKQPLPVHQTVSFAGKKINDIKKSKKHVLEHTEHLYQLYFSVILLITPWIVCIMLNLHSGHHSVH